MQKSAFKNGMTAELLLPLVVFIVLAVFTYGIFVQMPYAGIYYNPTDGTVIELFVPVKIGQTLQPGDHLQQIGSVSWDAYYHDANQPLFDGVQAGQIVQITVRRGDQTLIIPWVFPGPNSVETTQRLLNLWFVSYAFWLAGAAIQLFMRPKDARWCFLIATNYLTALWLMAGSLSASHLWGSSLLLHALTWLMLPAYLGLHWVFPRPLHTSLGWKWIWLLLCFASCALALGEFLQVFPRGFYGIGFVLTFLGSLVLLSLHFIRQPSQRSHIIVWVVLVFVALAPAISLGIIGLWKGSLPPVGLRVFIALPIMPAAYFYSIYRRQLGGLELRANRILSIYVFLILLVATLILLLTPFTPTTITPQQANFSAILTAMLTALGAIILFPAFQTLIERRMLGIHLPYENIQAVYAARISTSPSLLSLERLLRDEVLPSLLARQFIFLQIQRGVWKVLLNVGADGEAIPNMQDMMTLTPGYYRLPQSPPFDWVKLALPLKSGDETLGYWLLGRRDPDDIYTQSEIPVLQALADQTAIALSNIIQAERLSNLYKADVSRYEQERLGLAHDLHDDVLNQMAVLLMETDQKALPENFKHGYAALTRRIREITSGLRPPMLSYGYDLRTALIDLAENLMQRSQDTVRILVDIEAFEVRYPDEIEKNLFRIIQQGLENAMRHGHAANICLSGHMNAAGLALLLEDDGTGFETGPRLDLDGLLVGGHFGLAGMFERAALIDASLGLNSAPGKGTRISLWWSSNQKTENSE